MTWDRADGVEPACEGLDLNGVESSYSKNRIGGLFYALTSSCRPRLTVELGTFMGYSALHMAAALSSLGPERSRLCMVDLWDEYPYRHCSLEKTREHFRRNGLLSAPNLRCDFLNADAFEVYTQFQEAEIDLLHIDISNDGTSLQRCLVKWHDKLRPGGLLLIEGGSDARDRIEWMVHYDRKPIRSFLRGRWFSNRYEHVTLTPFPSITIARKLV